MSRFTSKAFVIYWIPVILWLGVIAIESTNSLSSENTGSIVIPILHWLFPRLSMPQLETLHAFGRKAGHFLGYGLLGYLFYRAIRGTHHVLAGSEPQLKSNTRALRTSWRTHWAILAVMCTASVAAADEIHQIFLPKRGAALHDVVLDTFGSVIFLLIVFFAARHRTSTTAHH